MTQPASTSRMVEVLITPLGALFGELPTNKMAIYLGAMKGYTEEDLQATFAWLRDNYEPRSKDPFPPISIIHRAKTSARGTVSTSGGSPIRYDPWLEQKEKRRESITAYMTQFQSGALYQQAFAGRYQWDLYKYVKCCANVQAQLLHPTNCIGYESMVVFQNISGDEAAQRQWWAQQREAAGAGGISVTVPIELIERWRNDAVNSPDARAARSVSQAVAGTVGSMTEHRALERRPEVIQQRMAEYIAPPVAREATALDAF